MIIPDALEQVVIWLKNYVPKQGLNWNTYYKPCRAMRPCTSLSTTTTSKIAPGCAFQRLCSTWWYLVCILTMAWYSVLYVSARGILNIADVPSILNLPAYAPNPINVTNILITGQHRSPYLLVTVIQLVSQQLVRKSTAESQHPMELRCMPQTSQAPRPMCCSLINVHLISPHEAWTLLSESRFLHPDVCGFGRSILLM